MRTERGRPVPTRGETGEIRKTYEPPRLTTYGDVVRITLHRQAKNRGVGDAENRSSVAN